MPGELKDSFNGLMDVKGTSYNTCTSTLLVVVFHGLAHGVMNYKPHIRFINSHAKSNSCHYNLGKRKILRNHPDTKPQLVEISPRKVFT